MTSSVFLLDDHELVRRRLADLAVVTTAILGVVATLVVLVWAVLAVSGLAAGAALISAGNALRRTR